MKSLTEGSNLLLLKACRRLLLGKRQPDPDVDDISANKSADVHFNSEGEVVVDDNDDDDDEIRIEDVSASQPVEKRKDNKPVNGSTASTIHFDDLDSAHWAVEGMAYITMNADVKEEIINDGHLVSALLRFAEVCYIFTCYFEDFCSFHCVFFTINGFNIHGFRLSYDDNDVPLGFANANWLSDGTELLTEILE